MLCSEDVLGFRAWRKEMSVLNKKKYVNGDLLHMFPLLCRYVSVLGTLGHERI